VLFLMPLLATIGPEPLMPAHRDGVGEPSERVLDPAGQQDIEMTGTDNHQGTTPPQYPDPLVTTKSGSVVPTADGSSLPSPPCDI
jgi:hypothetical protein